MHATFFPTKIKGYVFHQDIFFQQVLHIYMYIIYYIKSYTYLFLLRSCGHCVERGWSSTLSIKSLTEVATLQGLVDSCFKGASKTGGARERWYLSPAPANTSPESNIWCFMAFWLWCFENLFDCVFFFVGGAHENQFYRNDFIQAHWIVKTDLSHYSMKSLLSHSSFGISIGTMMRPGFQER